MTNPVQIKEEVSLWSKSKIAQLPYYLDFDGNEVMRMKKTNLVLDYIEFRFPNLSEHGAGNSRPLVNDVNKIAAKKKTAMQNFLDSQGMPPA